MNREGSGIFVVVPRVVDHAALAQQDAVGAVPSDRLQSADSVLPSWAGKISDIMSRQPWIISLLVATAKRCRCGLLLFFIDCNKTVC